MLWIALSVAALFAANVATPGASFILTLRHSMRFGPRIGRRVAWGLTVADSLYVIAALSGVAALLHVHVGVAATVGAIGGMWLGALGLAQLEATRRPAGEVAEDGSGAPMEAWAAFRVGLVAGLVNPQSVLFLSTVILASLPFAPSVGQGAVLAAAIAGTSLAVRAAIATAAAHRIVRNRYLQRHRQVEALAGLALLAYGMRLAVKSLFPWGVKALLLAGMTLHVIQ